MNGHCGRYGTVSIRYQLMGYMRPLPHWEVVCYTGVPPFYFLSLFLLFLSSPLLSSRHHHRSFPRCGSRSFLAALSLILEARCCCCCFFHSFGFLLLPRPFFRRPGVQPFSSGPAKDYSGQSISLPSFSLRESSCADCFD